MSLTIEVSPDAQAWLARGASAMSQDLPTYVAGLLDRLAAASKTLNLELDPIRQAFEESGMTEDQLGDLLEDAKHAMRAERRKAVEHG